MHNLAGSDILSGHAASGYSGPQISLGEKSISNLSIVIDTVDI